MNSWILGTISLLAATAFLYWVKAAKALLFVSEHSAKGAWSGLGSGTRFGFIEFSADWTALVGGSDATATSFVAGAAGGVTLATNLTTKRSICSSPSFFKK